MQRLQNDRVTISRGVSSGDKCGSLSAQFINGGSFRVLTFLGDLSAAALVLFQETSDSDIVHRLVCCYFISKKKKRVATDEPVRKKFLWQTQANARCHFEFCCNSNNNNCI